MPRDHRAIELLRIFYTLLSGIAIGAFLQAGEWKVDQAEVVRWIVKICRTTALLGLVVMMSYGFLVFFGF